MYRYAGFTRVRFTLIRHPTRRREFAFTRAALYNDTSPRYEVCDSTARCGTSGTFQTLVVQTVTHSKIVAHY